MSTTFNGTLTLTIADAKNLISQDYGRQDPYVKVSLGSKGYKKFLEGDSWGNETFLTKTHEQGGSFPVWNETHTINITNMQLDTRLSVALYDRDRFKDDYIGVTRLTLAELLENQGTKYYYDLTSKPYKPQVAGSIGIIAKFNCTEIPRFGGTLTDQIKDMHRRNQDKKVGQGPILRSQVAGPRPQTGTSTGATTGTALAASSLGTHQVQSGLESGVQQAGTSSTQALQTGTGACCTHPDVQSGTSGTGIGTSSLGTSGVGTSGTGFGSSGTGTYCCTYPGCTQSGLESGVQQARTGIQSGQGYTGSGYTGFGQGYSGFGQGYSGQGSSGSGYSGSGVQSGSYTNPLSTGQSSELQSGQPIPSNVPPTSSLPSGVSGVSGGQSGTYKTGQYDGTYKGQHQGDTYNKGQSVYQGQPIQGQPIQGQYVDQTGNRGIYQGHGQGTSY